MTRERTSNGTVPVSIFAFNFLCVDTRVKSQKPRTPTMNSLTIQKFISESRFKDYDIQELQCFDVPERGWDCTAQRIPLKLQPLKARQIAQRFRYGPCQIVPIQHPEVDRHILTVSENRQRNKLAFLSAICNSYRYWRFCSPPKSGIRVPDRPAFPKSLQKKEKQ